MSAKLLNVNDRSFTEDWASSSRQFDSQYLRGMSMTRMTVIAGVAALGAALIGMAGAAEAKQCTDYVLERLNVVRSVSSGSAGQQFYGYMPGAPSSEWVTKSVNSKFVNTFSGNAATWYDKAAAYPGGGAVSAVPKAGYVMVFAATDDKTSGAGVPFPAIGKYTNRDKTGHVAYVVQSPRETTWENVKFNEIKVDHANWSLKGDPNGNTVTNVSMISKDNWTTIKAEYYPDGKRTDEKGKVKNINYGNSFYNVKGFINPAAMAKLTIPKKK